MVVKRTLLTISAQTADRLEQIANGSDPARVIERLVKQEHERTRALREARRLLDDQLCPWQIGATAVDDLMKLTRTEERYKRFEAQKLLRAAAIDAVRSRDGTKPPRRRRGDPYFYECSHPIRARLEVRERTGRGRLVLARVVKLLTTDEIK